MAKSHVGRTGAQIDRDVSTGDPEQPADEPVAVLVQVDRDEGEAQRRHTGQQHADDVH